MKKTIGFVLVIFIIGVALLFNLRSGISPVLTDGNLPETEAEVLDTFLQFKASDIEKIIRENERIRFEQFGGSTKKQIKDTLE